MVERIVAAARDVLASDGYDAFSTNRVAERAGVSPGSLYQYFPDKAAILDVVVDRYWDDVAQRVFAALSERVATDPFAAREGADALLAALEADPVVLRVVAEELPLARHRDRRAALERQVRDLMTAALEMRRSEHKRPDPAATAWVIVLAIENLATRWVLDQPPISRDRVIDEMVALASGYLLLEEPRPAT